MKFTILLALTFSTLAHASSDHSKPVVVQPASDFSPRIMYWWGKVNQHVDVRTGQWSTDPDGVSGADLDKLEYCRKWYPDTTRVEPDKDVTIKTWRERGNVNAHTATRQSFRCVQR